MSVDVILMIITCLVSFASFNNQSLLHNLLMIPYRVKRNPSEAYRLLTSGFVHANYTHLIFNMLTFYFCASTLIGMIGVVHFVVMYLLAIIFSNGMSFFKNKDNPQFASLGASGGVSAIIFAFIYFNPWGLIMLFFVIPLPAILFAVAYVWYSYKMKDDEGSRIGHLEHLWGAAFGFLYMLIVVDGFNVSKFINTLIDIPYFK